ncbi:hypothetical protein [Alkalimonas amylolytica]|uniref:Uncharacterized protein n=1 Tax=Alkalimonas amylolytica TaxID=152573 RepID=A0A1H4BIP9_ALKAM|nr:hypothetical protein [Alkalimonas amylolytica]SEA47898.1 hypothetical protein SAMN04488051_103377 [Alkalimonas amylolytica]
MRFSAIVLIVTLLLKSIAGLAMAGCHADHGTMENSAPLQQQLQIEFSEPAANEDTAQSNIADITQSDGYAQSCAICASCCVQSTAADQTDNLPAFEPSESMSIHAFSDLSVNQLALFKPPKPFS